MRGAVRQGSGVAAAGPHPYVDLGHAPEWPLDRLGLVVLPGFVDEAEHDALVSDAERYLTARAHYEEGHWDGVIRHFREAAVPSPSFTPAFAHLASRVTGAGGLFPPPSREVGPPKPHAHVLELAAGGWIDAHVDSVKFSGGVVSGVCLLSDAVMLLTHVSAPSVRVTLLLPRRCVYLLTGPSRYAFQHSVPVGGTAECAFRGAPVHRGRRISLMFRDEKPETGEGRGQDGPTILANGRLGEEED